LARHLDQVKNINSEMHLQALNAIAKTNSLGGRGATLEVLSKEVAGLFRESSQAVARIVQTLELILHQAQQTEPQKEDSPAAGRASSTSTELHQEVERIGVAYDEFRETSARAAGLVQKQQDTLTHSESSLEFLATLTESIMRDMNQLAHLRETLAPWVNTSAALPTAEIEGSDRNYTMQSEREVHQRIAAADQSAFETNPPAAGGESRPGSAAAPQAAVPAAPAGSPASPASTPPPAKPASAPSPDDNIEFF
jgi:hypothetical protein